MARDYKKIKAWQLADELAIMVYKTTSKFPQSEIFGLTSQMRRAVVSVPANIAEGIGAFIREDFIYKMTIAWKEARESNYWLRLVKDSQLVPLEEVLKESEEIKRILGSIVKTSKTS